MDAFVTFYTKNKSIDARKVEAEEESKKMMS
jgi:hypothetical protein